jgi:hypothetical protein
MCDPLEWPRWWPGCRSVRELAAGNERRVGARFSCEWRGRVPYPVRFEFAVDEVEEPLRMRGSSSGALRGAGVWRLFEEDGLTAVTLEWEVSLARVWMRAIPRSTLRANHDWVMERGREGLLDRLGCG